MRRTAKLAGLLLLAGIALLFFFRPDSKQKLLQYTGISPCAGALLKMGDGGHRDVLTFDISVPKECQPSLDASIILASQGACRGLIELKGACSYTFRNYTVMAEKILEDDSLTHYKIKSF